MNSPWLEIIEVPADDRKTKVFEVYAKDRMAKLGGIKFFGSWRKYCFIPNDEALTVFDSACLRELAQFCDEETKRWRETVI